MAITRSINLALILLGEEGEGLLNIGNQNFYTIKRKKKFNFK